MNRTVILVDEENRPVGTEEVVTAHTGEGKLHRAFSVYIFRNGGKEILIQKRSGKKMLWPGIWANTCCSHPREEESPAAAGERRLREEMGFSVTLKPACSFVYRAKDPQGRGVEHEYVTVLLGLADETSKVQADPDEVEDWMWIGVDELKEKMFSDAKAYAPWFHLGMNALRELMPS